MQTAYTLITGATGFVGSHVAEKLLRDGPWPVVAIVRRLSSCKNTAELKRQGAILVEGRFYDPNLLSHAFRKFSIKNVVHLAAIVGEGRGGWKDYHTVNVRGTDALLSIAHGQGVDKFVYCSSVGVFGAIPVELPANPNTPLHPDNLYHQSKLAAENRVFDFIHRGLNAFIIRPTIAYGKRDTGFPCKLIKMVRRRILPLPFQDNRIHLVSVTCLADIFLSLLKAEILHDRVFIAADEGPVVLRELVNLIHRFYFGRNYPSFLKLPDTVFQAFQTIFRVIRLTPWLSRVQRICGDWYFDTSQTNPVPGFHPVDTKREFLRYLRTLR